MERCSVRLFIFFSLSQDYSVSFDVIPSSINEVMPHDLSFSYEFVLCYQKVFSS